jgi:hypothetical protein
MLTKLELEIFFNRDMLYVLRGSLQLISQNYSALNLTFSVMFVKSEVDKNHSPLP